MQTSTTAPRAYHHGQLRESLVEAGLELARVEGPSGLGLRAATRLAGVSHNAAYRHFADYDELLVAVGARCMRELALRMEASLAAVRTRGRAPRAWARLNAIGATYVEFAVTETGWFRTAFAAKHSPESVGGDAAAAAVAAASAAASAGDSGLSPYELLSARLDELVEVGEVSAVRRPGLEIAAWAGVHGLSTLLVDGPLRALPREGRDAALRVVLENVARGLAET